MSAMQQIIYQAVTDPNFQQQLRQGRWNPLFDRLSPEEREAVLSLRSLLALPPEKLAEAMRSFAEPQPRSW